MLGWVTILVSNQPPR